MTLFWQFYITVISLGCWAFVVWVLVTFTRKKPALDKDGTTGHVYDGIREYDKPMPGWWLAFFWATIVFGLIYFFLYPSLPLFERMGLSNSLKWSAVREHNEDAQKNNAVFIKAFDERYRNKSIEALSQDPKAVKLGQSLFLQNCAVCHGSNARGGNGFPNLTDNDWLYGGSPQAILTTLQHGRRGGMPAWQEKLGEQGIEEAAEYVLTLSHTPAQLAKDVPDFDAVKAAAGQTLYKQNCAVCHGPEGKGNQQIGAPNLTDKIWLYGGDRATIRTTLRYGRAGVMPAWQQTLGDDRLQLLSAYVYSLSHNGQNTAR